MILNALSSFAAACVERTFLGLPVWYHYLNDGNRMQDIVSVDQNGATVHHCEFMNFTFPGDAALIALGLLDIALRLAGLVAVGYVVYGGFKFVTSQGDPEGIKSARQTITNALIGLVIALLATTLVAFVGTRLV